MKTKISYVLSCILMLGFFATKAQSTAETRTTKIISEMTKACNLTADQQTKMQAIILTREKQKEADIAQYKGNQEGLKTAAKARNQKAKQDALTVISPEQMQQWKDYLQKKKAAMREKREQSLENSKSN